MAYALMEWDEYGNPVPPRQQPQAPPQPQPFRVSQEWYEDGTPADAAPPLQQTRTGPPAGYTDALGATNTLLNGLTLGGSDELSGFSNGVVGAVGAMAEGGDPRQAYLDRYRAYTDQSRDFQNEYARRSPWGSAFARGTGASLPIIATLGRGAPAALEGQAATRGGLGGLVRRSAEAGSVGSVYGYGAGFLSSDGDLQERALSGNDGALIGAATGAVLPPVLATANQANQRLGVPAWRALTGAARRLPTADPNALGSMGGNVRMPPRSQPPPRQPQFDPVVGGAIERLANRSRQTPAQLRSRLGEYRMNPQGQVLADAFDQPGVQTLRSMGQSPGQTGHRIAEVARARSRASPEILNTTLTREFRAASERTLTELNRRVSVSETPEQAMASLRRDYERVSADNYRPVFERGMTPEQRRNITARLHEYDGDRYFEQARREAEDIFQRDVRNGDVTGRIDDNFARYAHYIKMGMDDVIQRAPVGSTGAQANALRSINRMQSRIIQAMDDNIPGYRDARGQWGSLREAEDALRFGGEFVNQNSRAVREQMQAMTPFARYHARIGFSNEVANRIGLRGRQSRNVNVADVLDSPEMRSRVRAMFDNPEEAAAFLDTVSDQSTLMQNAIGWNGGSPTWANAAHADDNAANAMTEGALDVATGRPASAVNRLRNAASLGMMERANNRVGETLLRRVDSDEDFARAVVAELQRREAARASQAQTSRLGGGAAGSQQGRRE